MNLFIPFLCAVSLGYLFSPIVIKIARKYGLVDDPKKRYHPAHVHTEIIPRAGGLAIYLASITCIIIFIGLNKAVIGIIISSTILTVIGLLDDRKDINPYIRFLSNCLAALIVIGSGIAIPFITNPLSSGEVINLNTWRINFELFGPHSIIVWADILAFIWIMWTTNIVGWSAGVDGQMPGYVSISAAVLGLLSMRFYREDPNQIGITILAFIVSGAFLGFLPWNFFPQKIMPGYGGKTLAGFYLAILGILSYGKLGTALLVLGVPTLDAIYTLVRRIARGKSPVWADRGHLHHLLLSAGWGKRRIALFYWIVSAILGAVALTVNSSQKIFILLFAGVCFGGLILWLKFFTQYSRQSDHDNG